MKGTINDKRKAAVKNPVGPPRKMEGGRRVNVYLDAASLEKAAALGGGNVSEGIRKALNKYSGAII